MLNNSPLSAKLIFSAWGFSSSRRNTYSEFGFLSHDHIPSRTYDLEPQEVLAFRDYAFRTIFENPKFISKVKNKFGDTALKNLEKMNSIKLERKLLENLYG